MCPRARYLGALIAAAALVLGACGNDVEQAPSPDIPLRPTGVITSVEPAQGPVESFILEGDAGEIEVQIANEVDYGFDLEHLREHMETGDPVSVELEDRNGDAYALSIEDV